MVKSRAHRRFWGGHTPPDSSWNADVGIWSALDNHRMPSELHQSYDEVDLSQRDLTRSKSWPVILDEALRLVAPLGVLTLAVSDSRLGSMFDVMRRIYRWSEGRVSLVNNVEADGLNTFSIRLTHKARRLSSARDMDFVIISDGERPERIDRLVASVRDNAEHLSEYKIIVSSPKADIPSRCQAWGEDCLIIDDSAHPSELIGLRKNLAVQAATADMVLTLHDRYRLSNTFVKNIQNFGSDFSVVICRQVEEDGERFPDLVTAASDRITSRTAMVEYGDWNSGIYVNGGAVLAKRQILSHIPWNPLLSWGQREDVEWTRRLRDGGHEPRFCRGAVLVTLPPRSGYLSHFEPSAPTKSRYAAPGVAADSLTVYSPAVVRKRILRLRGRDRGELSLRTGVFLSPEWALDGAFVRLTASCAGTLGFRVHPRSHTAYIRVLVWGAGIKKARYSSSQDVKCLSINRGLVLLSLKLTEMTGDFVKISVSADAPLEISGLVLL